MPDDFVKTTLELIKDTDNPKLKETGYFLIREYKHKHFLPLYDIIPYDFPKYSSYPNIIRRILKDNGGELYIADVIDAIVQANIDTDKRQVTANVYCSLRRMADIVKVKQGLYKLNG